MSAFDERSGSTALAIAAGGAAVVLTATQNPLKLAHSRRWHLLIANLGANPITALRIRRRPLSTSSWGPWESITTGVPVAATTGTLSARETDDASSDLDVEVTCAAGASSVAMYLAGTGGA